MEAHESAQPEAGGVSGLSDAQHSGPWMITNGWLTIVWLAMPLALAGLELWHPSHVAHHVATSFFPVAGWWLTLHIIQFVLCAGLAGSIYLLTTGCHGISMVASRVAAIVFVVFYDLGEAVIGVGTGVLGHHAGDLSATSQAGRVEAITAIFNDPTVNAIYTVGRGAWLVTMLSAAVAILLHRHKPTAAICIALSGVILFVFDHPGPLGSLAFLLFFIGAVALQTGKRTKPALVSLQ